MYGLGTLSKKFVNPSCARSFTNQALVTHQKDEMHETIEKLNVKHNVRERTLQEKMEHLMKNHEQQTKCIYQYEEQMN